MELLNIFGAIVSSLSYTMVIGHVPFYHQQLFPRRAVPNEFGFCSESCLRYLARRPYFTDVLKPAVNPYYLGENGYHRTTNFEQPSYAKAMVSQAFLQKLVEIKNHEISIQNHKISNQNIMPKESPKGIQFMHELTEEQSNRNHYPLSLSPGPEVQVKNQFDGNVDGQTHFMNRLADDANIPRQLDDRSGLYNNQNLNLDIKEASDFKNVQIKDNEPTRLWKQPTDLNSNVYNSIQVTEKLKEQSHFPKLTAEQIEDRNSHIEETVNRNELIRTERHKVDAEKAAECAHLTCSLGNWTGPVCACNHVTGKVASFRNECDLAKHNCRFDTDFKTIQEDVCPWEYPSRRSFSGDRVFFDYDKDIYYNDDASLQ